MSYGVAIASCTGDDHPAVKGSPAGDRLAACHEWRCRRSSVAGTTLAIVIIISASDYRDAWDVILAWPDARDQLQVIAHAEERGQLPPLTIAWVKLLAAIAIELQLEEGFTQQLARVSVGRDVVPQLLARTDEMLRTVEPKFDPTKLGVKGLLDPIPEKHGFKEFLSDTTGLDTE